MSAHVLLVETAEGDIVGVRFPSTDAARDWEEDHETEVGGRGCVRLVSAPEALRLARGVES